ncbi:GntR family transcriptional regulator [Paenibacillus dendritiformis]|uniref:GntR family transcriptional regulator n=1 Tax=Paenibacillus dendritiformis TaxID=130049 RepID=UPI0018CE683F|nr:GntR family transcriptional regulator [Paenibacillus dendritiformis]MBG9792662.1 GntR family transcriptional regulator [Paenibacillus dendritiformis]
MEKDMIKPIKRMSLRDEVYLTLKKAIIDLELQPEQRLHDKELAEKFGISRTPVREALKRLEDEGLVESIPGSITRVAPLHLEEAKHAFPVVAVLHALAARVAVPLLQESDMEKLEFSNKALLAAMKKKDIIKAIEADELFHHVFLDVAGNPEIMRALERSISKIQRLEISQFASVKGLKSVEQHRQIIEACKKKDVEAAARLVEQNWLSLGEILTYETD